MTPARSKPSSAAEVSDYLLPADSGFEAAEMPGLRKAAILIMAVGEELAKDAIPEPERE